MLEFVIRIINHLILVNKYDFPVFILLSNIYVVIEKKSDMSQEDLVGKLNTSRIFLDKRINFIQITNRNIIGNLRRICF